MIRDGFCYMGFKPPVAWVPESVFNRLLEYSSSLPTGTTIGKQWKTQMGDGSWWLREYIDIGDPQVVGITSKHIIIVKGK